MIQAISLLPVPRKQVAQQAQNGIETVHCAAEYLKGVGNPAAMQFICIRILERTYIPEGFRLMPAPDSNERNVGNSLLQIKWPGASTSGHFMMDCYEIMQN